jgi:hypothetical protein
MATPEEPREDHPEQDELFPGLIPPSPPVDDPSIPIGQPHL